MTFPICDVCGCQGYVTRAHEDRAGSMVIATITICVDEEACTFRWALRKGREQTLRCWPRTKAVMLKLKYARN